MKKEKKKNKTFMLYPSSEVKIDAIVNVLKEEGKLDSNGKSYSKNTAVEEAIDYYYNTVVNKNPSFFIRIADTIVSCSLQKNFKKMAEQLNQLRIEQVRQKKLNEAIAYSLGIDLLDIYDEADKAIIKDIKGDENVG